jgi:hypothetical protein
MAIDEHLIIRLLVNQEVTDFEESTVFRTLVRDQPGAPQALLRLMESPNPVIAARAGEMLCLLRPAAVPVIARALGRGDLEWRLNLIGVVWAIVAPLEKRELDSLAAEVSSDLASLFDDRRPVTQPATEPLTEIDYEYRVCDEAFVLLRYLEDPSFDEDLFRQFDAGTRDAEIRSKRLRLGLPLA